MMLESVSIDIPFPGSAGLVIMLAVLFALALWRGIVRLIDLVGI